MKTSALSGILGTASFALFVLLAAFKLSVFPALSLYLLVYFVLAEKWSDATFVPYMKSFLLVIPAVWLCVVAYLVFRFRELFGFGPRASRP